MSHLDCNSTSKYDLVMYYEFFDPVFSDTNHQCSMQISNRLFSLRLSIPVIEVSTTDESNILEFASLGILKDDSTSLLTVGLPFKFTYSLLLRLHRTSISVDSKVELQGAQIRWRSIDIRENGYEIHCLSQRVVSVDICDTSSFLVVGPQRLLLSNRPLRVWKDGTPSSEASTLNEIVVPANQNFVEVEFTLHLCLAPLRAGALPLPPLRLSVSSEQSICFPNQTNSGVMSVFSVDSTADKLIENDCNRSFTQFVHFI